MYLFDVNILLYAHREDSPNHSKIIGFIEKSVQGNKSFGFSSLVLSGFLRVVTHPKVFNPPSEIETALSFIESIINFTNSVEITPGSRHWKIFTDLCRKSGAKGNLIPDAYFAAIAMEYGCIWVTTDRDFSRFAGLEWINPLD
ncbi:MAG: type II toxin-antitoxin system VapC family toxin [Spirochaetales bacterium]|nr:type II toxin-antitoxin system VapC family toxin [Spirochaetales bacterium]